MPNLEKVSAYSRSVAFRQQDNDKIAKATKCTSLTTIQAVPVDGYHGEGNSQGSMRSFAPLRDHESLRPPCHQRLATVSDRHSTLSLGSRRTAPAAPNKDQQKLSPRHGFNIGPGKKDAV